jgi:hypothetical protein
MLDQKYSRDEGREMCHDISADSLALFDFEQIRGLNKSIFEGKSG